MTMDRDRKPSGQLPVVPSRSDCGGAELAALFQCCHCGAQVEPEVNSLGNARDGYECAICLYSEFGYFPTGMTPPEFNPEAE